MAAESAPTIQEIYAEANRGAQAAAKAMSMAQEYSAKATTALREMTRKNQ